ncbi:MAG: asparagine synthase (glutamine-hydrolyzing) [Melioribacteraceae bacterium]|nr:asparagine synthase (glutamine-hydrolyzing) [Melioribacteraceae bacterium]
MCGIVSILNKENYSKSHDLEGILLKMLESMKHRGPDNSGSERIAENIYFGHNRLSIIDLDHNANQPMWDSTNQICITFNGEIYNYQDIRKKLQINYEFLNNSDTEVILNLYLEHGVHSFEKLDGIFSFVLYDSRKSKIYAVRDRVGKKPLYYYEDALNLIFVSELKAFSKYPFFTPLLNYETLDYCLSFNYSPDLSIFSNVKMLESGHYLEYDLINKQLNNNQYFNILNYIDPDKYFENVKASESAIVEEFTHNLKLAVKKRLISDVPVCSINSGGLDSSLISAIALEYSPNLELFHVNVVNNSEKEYAKKLAEYKNVNMEVINIDADIYNEYYEEAILQYEYYLVHPNSVALFMLSKFIKEKGYKVVLGGEAADELFGGYSHQNSLQKIHRFRKKYNINDRLQSLIHKYVTNPLIPGMRNSVSHSLNGQLKSNQEISYLERLERRFEHLGANDAKFRAFLLHDYFRYLQPLFLRGDKMFMGNSVELRLPFADIDLIKFSLNLPLRYLNNKFLIKKSAENFLPSEIIYRRKKGFPVHYKLKCNTTLNHFNQLSGLNQGNIQVIHSVDRFLSNYFANFS